MSGKVGPAGDDHAPIELRTSSAEETKAVAAAIAGLATAGDLLVLSGDLGAGKTAFTQGFGVALGVTEPITSPTFTIVREYQGRLALNHLDAYRLEHIHEVAELGIAEMLDEPAVMVVEWGDTILPALPSEYLEVRIGFGQRDDDRTLALAPSGGRWLARTRVLRDAVAPWLAQGAPPEPAVAGPADGETAAGDDPAGRGPEVAGGC